MKHVRHQSDQQPALRQVSLAAIGDREIKAARGVKNTVSPYETYEAFVERELTADGYLEDVATLFLSNKECPFRCLMCDLWQNTTDVRVPVGAISDQIASALTRLPPASYIKLYNSGNFFDAQAVPPDDLPAIARQVRQFRTVIVENHPQLCSPRVPAFQDMCATQLEVAIGLETSHAATLKRLNKQMTVDDFAKACEFLQQYDIRLRTFILLRPPETSETEGIERAIESVRFAFDCGVDCCCIIPTRPGNGIMDLLQRQGQFESPVLTSLEHVLNETVAWKRGRVFADLWNVEQFSQCPHCLPARRSRLRQMNDTQAVPPAVVCDYCESARLYR